MGSLEITLLYLLAAVLGVVGSRYLKLPPMLGYLVAGVLIGPHALALSGDTQSVGSIGEFGVVFLMFVIGLEFSLPKLRSIRQHVFGLGLLQVLVTVLFSTLFLLLFSHWLPESWKFSWMTALSLSFVMAMSSTAIVSKLMVERLELESEHGKRVMGILLLQDLAVVPLLVLIPALSASAENMVQAMAFAALKAAILITVLLVGGRHVMHWWLKIVARRKSEELFVLNLLFITLALSWLTQKSGLSLALGAFIAGMLISETEFKQQVETDIRPFHDVLLGLFFIGIGMLLDLRIVAQNLWLVLLLLIASTLFKAFVVAGLARAMKATPGVALRTGIYMAQAGEFGFVLLTLAQSNSLLSPGMLHPILASMVLSMLATPFMVMYSNQIVMRLATTEWMMQSLQMTNIARKSMGSSKHVIICGYGRCGQNLARMLDHENIPYIALDLDPDRVQQATAAGHSVVFGDAAKGQALMAAGLARASAVVITYLSEPSALKVLHIVKEHAPKVPVVVRTQDDHSLEQLRSAGAAEVVPEAIEGSLMLASHALALVGVPMRRVIRLVQEQREARYSLLRGYFHGADDNTMEDMGHEHLLTLTLPSSPKVLGLRLEALQLDEMGVRAIGLRRADGKPLEAVPDTILQGGETLVLSGQPEALSNAEDRLLRS